MLAPEAKAQLEQLEMDAANAKHVSIWDQWEPGLRCDASATPAPASAPAPPESAPAAASGSESSVETHRVPQGVVDLLDDIFN